MPTLRDIAGFFSLASLATVHEHLTNPYIRRRPNESRGIEWAP